MTKFTESQLEQAFIELLYQEEILHVSGMNIDRASMEEVLIKADLRLFLSTQYRDDNITENEVEDVIRRLENYPSSDLYGSNKEIINMVSNGFVFKREDRTHT
jgi:type I restriction enzyme R subunit